MRRIGMLVALSMALAILGAAAPAAGEEALTRDEKWVLALKKMRQGGSAKVGVAIIDAQVFYLSSNCATPRFLIGRVVDGKMRNVIAGQHLGLFGAGLDAVKALTAGEYFINSVRCSPGPGSLTLDGPHARFEVRAGEVVNAGTLRLEYKPGGMCAGGTLRRAVEPLRKAIAAAVTRDFPRAFAEAVNRPMKVMAAEATMRNNSQPLICKLQKAASR